MGEVLEGLVDEDRSDGSEPKLVTQLGTLFQFLHVSAHANIKAMELIVPQWFGLSAVYAVSYTTVALSCLWAKAQPEAPHQEWQHAAERAMKSADKAIGRNRE